MSSQKLQRLGERIFFAGMLNFLAFLVAAVILGGAAVNGKTENGRYYLSQHGHLTEVSRGVFNYSKFHAYSVLITHPLAILAGAASQYKKTRKTK